MLYSEKNKHEHALGNFDFVVSISTPSGLGEELFMGVDAVKGLNDATTNVIWYRESGVGNTTKTPYAGLSQMSAVTIEGVYMADLADLKKLQDWHKECKGEKAGGSLNGYRRHITITHTDRGIGSADLFEQASLPKKRQIVLRDCICTKLSLGDLDSNNQAFAMWTIEVMPKDLEVVAE